MGGPRWKVLIAHPETGDGIQLVAGIVFSSWWVSCVAHSPSFALPTAMPLYQSVDPLPIEALDQVGDGIPALPTSSTGSGPKAGPIGDCEQFLSSCDLGGRSTMESARLLEGETFTRREGTQWVFLTTGHGKLQGGETLTTVHQAYSGRH